MKRSEQIEIPELARLVARADSALTAATVGRGVDSHQEPLPNIDRNVHQALLDIQRAGAMATDMLLRSRITTAVCLAVFLLSVVPDAEASRPRREDWRPAVLTPADDQNAPTAYGNARTGHCGCEGLRWMNQPPAHARR